MPMSFIWKGRREFIQGYFYDENKWNKCLEDKSYFTPFVKIEYQGKQMPLCDFHKKNALGISWFSEEMLKYSRMIKKALNDIFTNYKKYSLELPSLLDRYIEKGMLHRTKSEEREGLFYLETEVFTKDELVEYILDVLISPLNLEGFFEKHSGRRKIFPFPALSLILTINYVIYQYKNKALLKDEKIVCYLEWGAFGACGYPPRLKGYTAEKFKKIRKIWRLCLDFNPELKPMFYVLLPSGIFNLLPHGFYEEDGLIMENFFTKYLKFTEENKDLSFDVLVQRLEDFASKNILVSKFSEYFQSRFKGNRFFYHQENIDKMEGDININPDFLKCSASSLCILVGWFFEGKHLL
jgi:hypothetical protein